LPVLSCRTCNLAAWSRCSLWDAKYDRQHYIDDNDYLGQAKKDGRRLVVIADGTDVFYQSRSTRLSSTPNIKLDGCLTALMEKIGPFVVDGEVLYYSYDGTEHRTGAQAAICERQCWPWGRPANLPVRYL